MTKGDELFAEMVEKAARALHRGAASRFEVLDLQAGFMPQQFTDDATAALEAAGVKELLAARDALLRLDWENIHTHYGYTLKCDDCNLIAALRTENLDAY